MCRSVAIWLVLVVTVCALEASATRQSAEAVAPLLFINVRGPEGTTVTFLEGPNNQKTFDAPVTVGMRPGHVYRLRFEGAALRDRRRGPDARPEPIHASLEVGGTLRLPPRTRAADHPAPLALTAGDIDRVFAGVVVTKVVLLEDPDRADARRDPANDAYELEVGAEENLFEYARSLGRPLAILRLGRREPEKEWLARQKSGNILYPGETALPPVARDPHCFPVDLRPFFRTPEECLRDGGDRGKAAHFDLGGRIEGIDPADTIAEYQDARGGKRLAISNSVCILSPRFLALGQATPLAGFDVVRQPGHARGHEIHDSYRASQALHDSRKVEDSRSLRNRESLRANRSAAGVGTLADPVELRAVRLDVEIAGLLAADRLQLLDESQKTQLQRQVEFALRISSAAGVKGVDAPAAGPTAIGMAEGLGQVKGQLETRVTVHITKDGELPETLEQPLQLLKWASTDAARPGDVVTFFIRYSNAGGKPISNIAISDSLTARLEYVAGSARSDREAIFVTQGNEADSLLLRWEIRDPLPPGARGVVSFQARIK